MKRSLAFLIFAAVVFSAQLCAAQNCFVGKVVDVVDGRSFVLETSTGKVSGVLQYIDVSEPEQPLHQTIKDHLGVLAVGKSAEFQVVAMSPGKFTGRLTIGGVDISLQMLRDGAAWLLPIEKSGQSPNEFAVYQESERLAKADRLGVWSIPDLKPAWVVRAEKEEKLRREQVAKQALLATRGAVSQFQTISRPGWTSDKVGALDKDAWLDVFAGVGKESPGLKTYSDPKGRFSAVYTSVAFVNFASGVINQRLECRVLYVDYTLVNGGHQMVYLIGFRAISDDFNFSTRASRLTITADGRSMSLGTARGLRGRAFFGAEEIMIYRLDPAYLRKIASAQNVQIRIDKLTGPMEKNIRDLIAQLISGTN